MKTQPLKPINKRAFNKRDHYKAHADKLAEALRDAIQHLDYCGYGDKWERECAGDLPERLEATLADYEKANRA